MKRLRRAWSLIDWANYSCMVRDLSVGLAKIRDQVRYILHIVHCEGHGNSHAQQLP